MLFQEHGFHVIPPITTSPYLLRRYPSISEARVPRYSANYYESIYLHRDPSRLIGTSTISELPDALSRWTWRATSLPLLTFTHQNVFAPTSRSFETLRLDVASNLLLPRLLSFLFSLSPFPTSHILPILIRFLSFLQSVFLPSIPSLPFIVLSLPSAYHRAPLWSLWATIFSILHVNSVI